MYQIWTQNLIYFSKNIMFWGGGEIMNRHKLTILGHMLTDIT